MFRSRRLQDFAGDRMVVQNSLRSCNVYRIRTHFKQLRESYFFLNFYVLCESYCEKLFFFKPVCTCTGFEPFHGHLQWQLLLIVWMLTISAHCTKRMLYCEILFHLFLYCFIHNKTGICLTVFTKQWNQKFKRFWTILFVSKQEDNDIYWYKGYRYAIDNDYGNVLT